MDFLTDPQSGMQLLAMEDWAAFGFVPNAQAIADLERIEDKTYEQATGKPDPFGGQ